MKYYFISDVHLGYGPRDEDRQREARLVSLLEKVRSEGEAGEVAGVFIVGDLFDSWFEFQSVIPRRHIRTIALLARIAELVPTEYLMGNHDFGHRNYFESERDRGGYPIWVTGPALVHSRARADMVWFVENGFVSALLAGNAVAVHDIEASIFGTTLGMTRTGEATTGGHGLHMRAINKVRAAGSIAKAVEQGVIKDGIMHACVTRGIPYVLTGSIRDDGPLPEVITDTLAAQDAMKRHTTRATMAILIATALHAIATGNMLPAFVTEKDGSMRELATICVDSSEFVVSKLKDRGTHQAFGVVTNAQDFMHILKLYVERELTDRKAAPAAGQTSKAPA